MALFLEHSGPILLAGILLEILLGSLLVRTGRGIWLLGMAGVLLLTIGGILLERWIETPAEQVAKTLYAAAAALEQNDVETLFQYISPTAQYTPQRARSLLRHYRVRQARISQLQIEINPLTSPPSAGAQLWALISVETVDGQPFYTGRVGLEVRLQQETDRWRITGHQEKAITRNW